MTNHPTVGPPDEPGWVIMGPVSPKTYKATKGEQYWYAGTWYDAVANEPYYASVYVRHQGRLVSVNTDALLARIAQLEEENAALHRILTE